jgi:hypothetical protein
VNVRDCVFMQYPPLGIAIDCVRLIKQSE